MKRIIPLLIGAALVVLAGGQTLAAQKRPDKDEAARKRSENLERRFRQVFDKLNSDFALQVKDLAAQAAEKGMKKESEGLWKVVLSLDPDIKAEAPKPADATPTDADKAAISAKAKALSDSHAAELFKLGGQCFKAGLAGRAYDMVWEAVGYNTDHDSARKLLGMVKYKGEWMDAWEAGQLNRGKIFSDEYGWVNKADLPRYEKGLMPLKGRWLPAEKVEEVRSKWDSAWIFDTEHYHIQSDVGLADAVSFGKTVEENYQLFFRVFIGYFSSKSQGEMLFGNKQEKTLFKVNYFATKDEFIKSLPSIIGPVPDNIAGMYMPLSKTANFFKINWEANRRILKHEATHQLIKESRHVIGMSKCGAWTVEAAATYMESVNRVDGRIVTEGRKTPWVKGFTDILNANRAIALKDFDQLDYMGFQGNGAIGYPQSAALACFLMEAQDGNYRERFIDYLEAYYTGKLDKGQLDKFCGVSYYELDDQFRNYILSGDLDDNPGGKDKKTDTDKKDTTKTGTEKK